MNANRVLNGVIAVWIIVIVGFIGYQGLQRVGGEVVLLKTIPRDPVDYMRGDYVVLDYMIEREFEANDSLEFLRKSTCEEGDGYVYCTPRGVVYLGLKTDEQGIAYLDGGSKEKPKEGLFIRAEHSEGAWGGLNFGTENYFIPRGKGHYLENINRERMLVKTHISKNGKARIIDVLIDGKEIDWSQIKKRKDL